MAHFFLKRPVFSIVLSIFLTIAGFSVLGKLPIEQYPLITPPQILIKTRFPGATAETMAESVAAPLEQAVNGVENMIYMFSQSAAPGNLNLNVYFEIGTDPSQALTNTQNRVNLAMSSLPQEVQLQGIQVEKQFPTILLFIALESTSKIYNDLYLANYAATRITDELSRIKGVSSAPILNARDFSMRIWLKPDRLAQFDLSASEVIQAIKSQNADRSIGQIGQEPTTSPIELTIPVNSKGRLDNPEEFEQIVLRANEDGSMILLRDIGRVELGAKSYDILGKLNNEDGTFIGIYQDSSANAIDVANSVKAKMEELSRSFPSGVSYNIPYDTTEYIKTSIFDVQKTLLEAALLVSLVIFVFLQNFRASLVPIAAMVVSIVGTLLGLYLLGFSINTLTLFGMVLSVGIVVDDAIVVVESVEHNMKEHKLSSFDAAKKTMEEVSSPIIAIVLVLCAIFIPVAFIGGIPGKLYQQFAVTISVSVFLSGFVALTLSPVMAAFLLKNFKEPPRWGKSFNNFFDKVIERYIQAVEWTFKKPLFVASIGALVVGMITLFIYVTPLGLVPEEDQGLIMITAQLPDAASLSRVEETSEEIEHEISQIPGIKDILFISGYSLVESIARTNSTAAFISLKPWKDRNNKTESAAEILNKVNQRIEQIPSAKAVALNPPLIPGIGFTGGFDFWVVDQGESSMDELNQVVDAIVAEASTKEEFAFFVTSIQANCMELYLDVDVAKARSLGVDIQSVYETLQILLGSVYVNNFNKFGKVFQVVAQAEPVYRDTLDDIGDLFVLSKEGKRVPIKSLVVPKFTNAPTLVSRFNGNTAALISVVPNASPERVITLMEEIASKYLRKDMSYSWGGIGYQEKTTGGSSGIAFIGALAIMFLILAALYERWSLPLSVLLAIPFAVFGAFLFIWIFNMANDVYFQIGLITLIGLSAKNSILIVEFASAKKKEGMQSDRAAIEGARLRFRAIMMTSLTMIVGMLPLVVGSGAGAASQKSVGMGVIGGMIGATFFAIFFVPYYFLIIERVVDRISAKERSNGK